MVSTEAEAIPADLFAAVDAAATVEATATLGVTTPHTPPTSHSVPLTTTAMPIHPMATQALYGHTGFPPMSMHHFGMQSAQPQLQVQHPGAPTPIQWINQDGTHAPPSSATSTTS